MANFFRFYTRCLEKYPWRTQAIQTGILMGTGDIIAQTVVEKRRTLETFDPKRTARFAVLGVVFIGPTIHGWLTVLNRIVTGNNAKIVVLKKVAVDQGVFAPILLLNFLIALGAINFQPWDSIKAKIKREYKDVLTTAWTIWPAAQVINFYFVPPIYRLTYVNVIALFWNTYLSYATNKEH